MMQRKNIKVLITGANFCNKGAQAMLFITVDELRKRNSNIDILFQTGEDLDVANFRFEIVRMTPETVEMMLGGWIKPYVIFKRGIKDLVKLLIGKHNNIFSAFIETKIIKQVDFIIDISGYAIGDTWSYKQNIEYANKVNLAKKLGIPIFLMPQSVGNLEFASVSSLSKKKLVQKLRDALNYATLIYVREGYSKQNLEKIGVTQNVTQMYDMVLQHKIIDWNNIFCNIPRVNAIQLNARQNIAMVPNIQLMKRLGKEKTMKLYGEIIRYLSDLKYGVYIFSHSDEDQSLCSELFNINSNYAYYEGKKLDCREFGMVISSFDLLISSRYHALVHALKECVPCIAISWDEKYKELMSWLGQSNCYFDYKNKDNDKNIDMIKIRISETLRNSESVKQELNKNLDLIQNESCFGFLDTYV